MLLYVVMIFGPAKGYTILLEIGPTGQTDLPSRKAASGWVFTLAGTPAGHLAQRWGALTFGWVSKSSQFWSNTEINPKAAP